jgi:multicomponent Na+:H+ antiporter subunit D
VGELLLHPALPLSLAAILCWFVPRRVGRVLVVAAPVVALWQLTQLDAGVEVTTVYLDFDLVVMRGDQLALAFAWVFAIAAAIAGTFGLRTMSNRERTSALAYAAAAMAVVFAGDLLTFFVAWEVKAVASTFVVLHRRGGNSGRAGMRYLFFHVLGGKLLLAGVLWHLADTGSLAFASFDASPATVLILLACALSAAIPPLHAWLPDAYPEATVAGTVFLSAYTTKAAVYALARGFAGWEVLVWVGVFMALYGVVYAVLENDVRRLLGYHIISQVGYMVAAVGVGTELAINGATAHAFAHILYKGLLLMGVGAVIHATGRTKMSQLGGIANRMRGVLALYMVGAVSISSFPLFSGFVSKELAVEGVSVAGYGTAVVLLKIASVGTFLHTGIKLPYGTWFGTAGWGPRTDEGGPFQVRPVPASMYVAMAIGAVLNTVIGVRPQLLYDLLPHPVEYDVYTLGKVAETSQILLFTALASWLLISKLGPSAMISLDADWVYRRLPRVLVERRMRGLDDRQPPVDEPARMPEAPAPVAGLVRARTVVLERMAARPYGDPPPVASTWVLGAVVLSVAVLLLSLTLVTP